MAPAPRRYPRCAQLDVQCNGRSPCSRCTEDRVPCRATRQTSESHQAVVLPHRSQSPGAVSLVSSESPASSSNRETVQVSRTGRTDIRFSPLPLSIDEYVTPTLAAKATSAQQTQLYINFILSAIPCYFKVTETRVSINWVEYVDARRGGSGSPFDWAIRSLTTIYTGSLHNDPRLLEAGRELYIRSLRGLFGLLGEINSAKSDEAIATAISLTVFEMHSCTNSQGWIHHATGIWTLMRLRGPQAHLHGFGRACYIACRNLLVTTALVSQEECFLAEPEWQALNEQIAADNAKQPNSSVYTDITERAFREVVKLPGFVKRMCSLSSSVPDVQTRERSVLLREILATRASLRGIYTEFGVSVSALRAGYESQSEVFIGPMPHHFFDGFTSLSIRGIRSGILLLNYLIILLDPSQRAAAEAENCIITDRMQDCQSSHSRSSLDHPSPALTSPGSPGRPRLLIQSRITPETREAPTSDWMDRIATTMGMDGVRVTLVDEEYEGKETETGV